MHIVKVELVPHGLKVSANDEKIHFFSYFRLKFGDVSVYLVKLTVKTSLDCNFHGNIIAIIN